jgi:hypothetical protein
MRARFLACPACARHVRAADSTCPFCGAATSVAKPLRRITERLSRAALHAAGAAGAVVAISDCSSDARSVAFYGAACIDGSCNVVTDSGADATDANPTVFYGAPCLDGSCLPPQDAGDAGSPEASVDAAEEAGDAGASDAPVDGNGGE